MSKYKRYLHCLVVVLVTTALFDPDLLSAQSAPVLPSLLKVRVKRAYSRSSGQPEGGIGDVIVVQADDLQSLLNYARCLSSDGQVVPGCTERQIALFLDGREIKGMIPESGSPLPEDNTLQYHLQRTTGTNSNDEAWADLLGAPGPRDLFYRPTAVSVGLENTYALPSDVKSGQFRIVRIRQGWFWGCAILTLIILILLVVLGLKSGLLRDTGPSPSNGQKPYSLARFQMAVWFVLVVISFLFIWLTTGAFDTITGSVLALIGIGAGTALGAASVDIGKSASAQTDLDRLEAEALALKAATPVDQARLNLVQAQIGKLEATLAPRKSDWFLYDVLTDEQNTISFHRFQMFVWTLVLAMLFIYSVWHRLAMPDFGTTLLALMGISSGTYLGFKIPEKQN